MYYVINLEEAMEGKKAVNVAVMECNVLLYSKGPAHLLCEPNGRGLSPISF